MPAIKILIVDDHEVMRRNIAKLLSSRDEFTVVGQASDGLEAIRRAEQYQPDVILLDIGLPELNGLQATPLIKRVAPHSEIIIVTSHEHVSFVREAFGAGARGFLPKSDVGEELLSAIDDVYSKKSFLSRRLKSLCDSHVLDSLNVH